MEKEFRQGGLYQDRKGNTFQVAAVATYTATGEPLVVYQEMFEPYGVYAASPESFVEKLSAPYAVFSEGKQEAAPSVHRMACRTEEPQASGDERQKAIGQQRTVWARAAEPKQQPVQQDTEEPQANPYLLEFLDADTYEEKYRVVTEIRDEMTDRLIDDIAVVLDVVIPEGNLDDRYLQLKNIIVTRQRFETNRFR